MEKLQATTQKSYYGKAAVECVDYGNYILYSYGTKVAEIKDGKFIRHWGGYSVTTMNHINDFRKQYGNMEKLYKKGWLEIPVENAKADSTKYQVVLHSCMGFGDRKIGPVFDDYTDALSFADKIHTNNFWFADVEYV